MAKKQKEETPNINATPNRDIIQRLNFLYQASVYLQSVEPSASIPISDSKGKANPKHTQNVGGTKKKKHKRRQTTGDLARSYVQCMRVVAQKTTVKMYEIFFSYVIRIPTQVLLSDPALKRSLCYLCNTTLIPGSSASVRVKSAYFTHPYPKLKLPDPSLESSSHGHQVVYTCLHCKSSKGIPAPPTLDLGLAAGTEASTEGSGAVPGSLGPGSLGFPTMAHPSQSQVQKEEKKKKKKKKLHPLPLFARPDAGHVVFKGNEVLNQQEGLGVCFI